MYTAFLTTLLVITIATHTGSTTANRGNVETTQDDSKVAKQITKQQEKHIKLDDQIQSGELNLDHPEYFEGDIRLTPKQQDYVGKDGLHARALTSFPGDLWPNGVVPYTFASDLSDESKGYINSAIAEWNSKTCINIRPKESSDTNYIEFDYQGGCSSNVGMVGGKQTISVGSTDGALVCQHGNVVHELSHSLGYFHEHSRPDRDEYVSINRENIKSGFEVNFKKMGSYQINSLGVPYDYGSITHYGLKFFTKNGLQTIEATQTVSPEVVIGQRTALSDYDVQQAKLLYKCADVARKSKVESIQDKHESPAAKLETKTKPQENQDKQEKQVTRKNKQETAQDPTKKTKPQGKQIIIDDQATSGELNLDHPEYFEGDMRLTLKQKNVVNDIVQDGLYSRALVKDFERLWPEGQVPYTLGSSLSSQSRGFINSAITEWNRKTCVNIRPKTFSDTNYIEFLYEGGCSSNVGMIGGRQTISVGSLGGPLCSHGNIVHEIAHTLGFFHEHSRPDRDSYISINWNSIKSGYYFNFKKMDTSVVNSRGVPYDYDSITHYGLKFFSNNGLQTIQPLQPVPPGVHIGQRIKLSDYDVQQANLLYKCPGAARKNKVETTKDKPRQTPSKVLTKENTKPQQKHVKLDDQTFINGELNLDHPEYFEGDILLTQQQQDFIASAKPKKGLYSRGISGDPTTLWPNGEVPYVMGAGLRDETKANILSAINEWKTKTDGCINIREKLPSDFHYVEFIYNGGCSSNIGMTLNRQVVSVGSKSGTPICSHGNIVHELAHVLGFYHEQSRPDRDDHITVNWGNIIEGFQKNFKKEDFQTINSRGVPYDFNSVTHYGSKFFSTDRNELKTIETKPAGMAIGQRVGLSPSDVKQAKMLYNCNKKTSIRKSKVDKLQNTTDVTKKPTIQTVQKVKIPSKSILKNAVKQFVQISKKNQNSAEKKTNSNASERSEIAALEQQFDSMMSDEQTSDDSKQTPLTAREKKILAELKKFEKNGKADDAEDISGEENIGKHYFEGDMMLSDKQKHWFDSNMKGSSTAGKRALISNPMLLWQNHTMPIAFDGKVDNISREYTKKAIEHWQSHTCLRFPMRNKEKDYVLFVFEGGCSSRVGRVGGMQKINIGSPTGRCKIGNIIHEMGHALGFFHEQSRPDRDNYVRVLEKNVIGWYLNNFHQFRKDFIDSLGVPYDYHSIMHYGRTFFSRNHFFFPTLVPLYRDIDDHPVHIGQRIGLSDMDVLQGNLLYQCDGRKRLTKKESHKLYAIAEHSNKLADNTEVPCKDRYNNHSCNQIKKRGYCQRFPRPMRHACGRTCQLCGTTPPDDMKKNLFTKLNLHKFDKK